MWLTVSKDGGPESNVTGYFLVELKRWFTIALLRFDNGTRDAFHSHAFNSWSWVLKGQLSEEFLFGQGRPHFPSWKPIKTEREHFHQVRSIGTTWVLTFRGPWHGTWREYLPKEKRFRTLTNGRVEVTRQ